ncbi:hypothetical protein [Priestia megaterium]|uniref:oxidoreductase n=1 Tax=Priestia megaterium TaxID=1404 RepID=UPI001FB33A57|nr:hypothetical protein [Priestia megaterium]
MRVKTSEFSTPETISYRVRNQSILSRFFFAPINTGFSQNGNPSQELIDFHKKRSGKGIGISYVGNVAISHKYTTNKNTSYFNEDLSTWEQLSNSIKKSGSVPGIQIACRNSSIEPNRKMKSKKHEEYVETVQKEILNLSIEKINEIIKLFIENAVIAEKSGFRVIQIHAAHGYFLSQMLNPLLNIREDEYRCNEINVISNIVQGIRDEIGDNVLIDVRLSLIDGLKTEEEEIGYKEHVLRKLTDLDIDIISFSNGIYDINKHLIYPLETWGHGFFVDKVVPFAKRYPEILWNVCGNIWDLRELNLRDLPVNLTFSIGRSLIADPDFLQKSLDGIENTINYCERKHHCHYYSLGKDNVTCPIYEKSKIDITY